jgi:hypothetical protein
VSSDPQADPIRDTFIERLTAHLDRSAAPGPDADSSDRPDDDPGDRSDDSDVRTDDDSDVRTDADSDLESDLGSAVPARLDGIVAALTAPATWSEPPDLRSALLTRIRAQAGDGAAVATAKAGPTAETAAPPDVTAEPAAATDPEPAAAPDATAETAAGPDAEPATEPRLATVTPLRPRWQRLSVALPLAAAAAVLVTLTVLGVQAALRPGPDAVFVASGAGGLRADVSVTSKPSGFEITLETDDLPAAPAGSYYAAWLRRGPGPGDVVPIGTFHGRRVGEPIVLWSGVDPADYRTFSVTLQRDGEPPLPNAPSARRVLAGTVNS